AARGGDQRDRDADGRDFDDPPASLIVHFDAVQDDAAGPADGPVADGECAIEVVVDFGNDERAHGTGAGDHGGEDDQQDEQDQDREDHPWPAAAFFLLGLLGLGGVGGVGGSGIGRVGHAAVL